MTYDDTCKMLARKIDAIDGDTIALTRDEMHAAQKHCLVEGNGEVKWAYLQLGEPLMLWVLDNGPVWAHVEPRMMGIAATSGTDRDGDRINTSGIDTYKSPTLQEATDMAQRAIDAFRTPDPTIRTKLVDGCPGDWRKMTTIDDWRYALDITNANGSIVEQVTMWGIEGRVYWKVNRWSQGTITPDDCGPDDDPAHLAACAARPVVDVLRRAVSEIEGLDDE